MATITGYVETQMSLDFPLEFFLSIYSSREEETLRWSSSDNLTASMFIAASDLSEARRERLTSSLSLQGVDVPAHTF